MRSESKYGDWRTSRHSGSSANCVQVAAAGRVVGVRDSKQRGRGPILEFTEAGWRAFAEAARKGTLGTLGR
jgi:hypothetical protein